MYTKRMFLEDVKNIHGKKSGRVNFWYAQYDLYALGHRGPVMHDTTLVLMSQWEDDQFVPPTDSIDTILKRGEL